MNRITPLAVAVASAVCFSPFAARADGNESRATASVKDIVDTAVAAGSFQTLIAAVKAAGLVDTLKGEGPFTVFAPTDAAFAKLKTGTVEGLLEPAARERLTTILAFHVVSGRVLSKSLLPTSQATTLAGQRVSFGLKVGSASVIQADILCSNGVIHVIDEVLLPSAPTPSTMPTPSPTAVIRAALDRGVPLYNDGDAEACVAAYAKGAAELLRLSDDVLGPVARADVGRALRSKAVDPSTRAWDLRHAFDRILDDEAFQPLVEAPMPADFPKPGPVGHVTVKQYPAYRAARAKGRSSFFTLFGHIQKNSVAMTAPVEMTMDDGGSVTDMAFLYESKSLGRTGSDGEVTVVDHPAATVISFGLRGEPSDEVLALARTAIEARMRADGMTVAGPWRRLGYNSPMVANERRFSEIQLPVRR